MRSCVRGMLKRAGATTLLAAHGHSTQVALAHADQVVLLEAGTVKASGPVAQLTALGLLPPLDEAAAAAGSAQQVVDPPPLRTGSVPPPGRAQVRDEDDDDDAQHPLRRGRSDYLSLIHI